MSGLLLDTNIPSESIRSRPDADVDVWVHEQDDEMLHLSVVTIGELRKGLDLNVADAIAAITELLSFLHVLPIPAPTVEGWLDLLRRRHARGVHRIYTYNTGDFEGVKELAVAEP